MKSIDLIRYAMSFSEQGTNRIVEEMKNAPLTQPTSRGGNHSLWNMGHLAFTAPSARSSPASPIPSALAPPSPLARNPTEAPILPSKKSSAPPRSQAPRISKYFDAPGKPASTPQVIPGFEDAMQTNGRLARAHLHNMVHYETPPVPRPDLNH
jgi:hypothetical protein